MNDHNDYFRPDNGDPAQQQREAEEECWELSMEALEWAQEHGMPERLLKHLAYECNVRFTQIGKEKHAAY